jgi:hypothetical protein
VDANRLTVEEAATRYKDLIRGQKWKGANHKYWFWCSTHGKYLQRFTDHERYKCQQCGLKKRANARRLTIEEVERRHKDFERKQRWRGAQARYRFRCSIHGKYLQTFYVHDQGSGCPQCGLEKSAKLAASGRITVNKIKKKFPGELVSQQKYTNRHQKLLWRCLASSDHPNYLQSYQSHCQGTGCPRCHESKGEKRIAVFLFERQKRFPTCKNKRSLPFDFRIRGRNILVEYQGQQHFTPFKIFGGKRKLRETKRNDALKRKWARANRYRLISIPYHVKDVEGYLIRRLSKISADYAYFDRKSRLVNATTEKSQRRSTSI